MVEIKIKIDDVGPTALLDECSDTELEFHLRALARAYHVVLSKLTERKEPEEHSLDCDLEPEEPRHVTTPHGRVADKSPDNNGPGADPRSQLPAKEDCGSSTAGSTPEKVRTT